MQNNLKTAIYWALFFAFLLYWTSPDGANNKAYTKSLEKIVAKCLDGGAVTIGGEVHLCSVYNIGEKI